MKKLLIFLIIIAFLASVGCGVYLYLDATGYIDTLVLQLQSLFDGGILPPTDDGDTTPPTNGEPAQPTPQPPSEPQTPIVPSGPGYDENGTLVAPDEALYALLYDAATSFTEEVDIAHLEYTPNELEEEISRFFFAHPDLFYVDNGYSVYTAEGQSVVRKIRLRYLTTQAEAQEQLTYYNDVLEEVVADIPVNATEFDKVLYLHDYLVRNYAYDYEGLAEENATGESVAVRDVYQFFKGKVGVCQAYMLAMIALCEEAGISCLPVTSDEMSHAWNLVELDGEWYHVDVTWDDAGGESSAVYPSYVSYKYFLLSGEALYESGRTAHWQTSESANSEKYDDALWHRATTSLCKKGEEYLCVLYDAQTVSTKLYCGTPVAMEVLATVNTKWYSGPHSYYQESWASVFVWNARILVSTASGFLYYDAQASELSVAVDLSASLGKKQIFGVCDVDDDGTVTYVAALDYKGAFELRTWQADEP